MRLAEGITKHGFRTWYERQLLQSHGHLALSFLCLVGVFAAFEALMRFRGWRDQVVDIAAIGLCLAAGVWALRRYLYLLSHAEAAANQAVCSQCEEYGRLRLVGHDAATGEMHVGCTKCGHEWTIAL